MKPFEEQFTAWVDGKLSGQELTDFEQQLEAQHPAAAAEKADTQRLGAFLRRHPTAPALSNLDFFNHQIMQQIAADQPRGAEPEKQPFWRFSLSRLAWAGAACLIISIVLFKTMIPTASGEEKSKYFAQVVEAWPSEPGISANTVYSPEDNVTVVWLDGLEYIPASYALK